MLLNRAILAPATCKNQLLLAQTLFDVGWSDEGKERGQIYTVKGREANKKNIKRTNIITRAWKLRGRRYKVSAHIQRTCD